MAGYCMSVWPHFHEPQASENTAQECNIQLPSHTSNNRFITYYCHFSGTYKIDSYCTCAAQRSLLRYIFNELLAVGLFLALDGTSKRTDPSTSGRKYCKLVVFLRNESLFVVSAVATSAFQLKHTTRLLRSICPAGYRIRTIEYGKILVMLLYGKYYWRVYWVYNNHSYMLPKQYYIATWQ